MSNPTSISTQKKAAFSTKQIVILALFSALSIVVMFLSKVMPPVAGFLQFDLKDTVIAIGGFLFGPLSAVAISVVVSFIEMLMPGSTGPIGLLMNVLATCAFVCPAAYVYKRNHSFQNAVIGLIFGGVLMTITMLLWNYIITPWFLHVDRAIVVAMMIPTLLPFNLLKAGMNIALTILLYKPVVNVLRKVHLVAELRNDENKSSSKWGLFLFGAVLLVTCVLLGLIMAGKI